MLKRVLLLLLLAITPLPALAAQDYCMDAGHLGPNHYMNPSEVDLINVLGPPPALGSPGGQADLQAVIEAQEVRTPAEIAKAKSDSCLSIFRFAGVMGPGFKAANLPFTIVFFQRVFDDGMHGIAAAKKAFNRPRPFVVSLQLKPLVAQPPNPSYPSGTATFAIMTAILLADMVPEKAQAIFERAFAISYSRVIVGIHYPSDLVAGRIAAAVIDNVLLHDAAFQSDLAKSRAEVRKAVGLSKA